MLSRIIRPFPKTATAAFAKALCSAASSKRWWRAACGQDWSTEGFAIDAPVIEADASAGHKIDGKLTAWPATEKLTRPVREYLAALDHTAAEAAQTEDANNGHAAWQPARLAKGHIAYRSDRGVDQQGAEEGRVCLWRQLPDRSAAGDYRRRRGNTGALERGSRRNQDGAERTRERFGLNPQRLAADAAYGSGLMIGWLMRRRIEPHIPLLDREHQTNGFFTRAEFTFDPQANLFVW